MKKTVLTIAMLTLAAGAWAQKSKIRTAKDYLSDNNFRKAIPELEEAVVYEGTKNDADAWYYRGYAYYLQARDSAAKTPNSMEEARRSFMKTLELKPDYNSDINNAMQNLAILYYRDGAALYNNATYDKAYEDFMQVYNLYNVNGGKRFGAVKDFKDLALNAKNNAALAALNAKKEDEALKLLTEIKNEQTVKDSNIYFSIIEILERQKKYDDLIVVVNEAAALYPNNKQIRTSELNYYIATKKTDQLLPKLEAAAQADPNNQELQMFMGNTYEHLSFPKDETGKALPRPANADELFSKAETAYKNVVTLAPENPEYNYNLGVLYYEVAVDYNRQMNATTGSSAAETKKYNELLAKRDAQFAIALPHLEKAYNLLDARAASLSDADKVTYIQSLRGLLEIYTRQNNKVKADALRKKLDANK